MARWYVLTKPGTDECVAITTLEQPEVVVFRGDPCWVGRQLSDAEYKTYRRMRIPIVSCYLTGISVQGKSQHYLEYDMKPDIRQYLSDD